ncbi:MAG: hypothetical protein AAB320_09190 [Elusimicrobiota bacterium]
MKEANRTSFRRGYSGNPGGRPRKTPEWRRAEEALREAIPRIMAMKKNALQQLLANNPIGVEMIAARYLHECVPQVVDRFLGKTPVAVSGKDDQALIPDCPATPPASIDFAGWTSEMVDKFIEAAKPT